jgi:uncharacterized protein (DUF2062 family)
MLKARATPHDIALGFACGTFWCILPTPGLSILLAFATAGLVRMSRLSMVASVVVWNPLFVLPLYPTLALPIGQLLLDDAEKTEFKIEILNTVARLGGKLFVGSAIVATIIAVIAYFLIRRAAELYQKRKTAAKERRLQARLQAHAEPPPYEDAEPCALPVLDDDEPEVR